MEQDNDIEDPECPEWQDVGAVTIVPTLSRPTRKSQRQARIALVMVGAMEIRRNMGVKEK
jgi:hypothetical protein